MIEPKEKPCKGTGLAKGYGCDKKTKHRVYGLGKMCGCYTNWLLNSENGKIKMAQALRKVSSSRKELENLECENKERSALKKAHSTTKTIVHAFVRERDQGKPCISCGNDWKPNFQAGHGYAAGSFETLKYNLHNIHGQCEQCNLRKEGDFFNYSLNLPARIGVENYNELVRLAGIDKHFSKVWNVENLKEIREEIKKLKKL
jgi:hypothetical protein